MRRNKIVEKLINEGFSEKTLVNFSDRQLSDLSERIFGEAITTTADMLSKSASLQNLAKKQDIKLVGEDDIEEDMKRGQKKLDKNKNGKLDKEDFKLLRKGKEEFKESFFGKKFKKVDTIKYGGHEMDVWDDGNDKLIGHPKKQGTKSSAETQNSEKLLGYGEEKLNKLKKSIDDINSGKKDVSFPLHKKKFDNPKFKKTIVDINETKPSIGLSKEKNKVRNWVSGLVNEKYHSFTKKGEIMELIQSKMTNSVSHGPNVKKGHNGIPEFMSYDSIVNSEVTEDEVKTKPKVTPKPGTKPKKDSPYSPKPGKETNPKALTTNEDEVKTKPKVAPKPGTKPKKDSPYNPKPGKETNPKALNEKKK